MFPHCIRVIDLETAGNGPSDVCEIGWQDVVQGEDGRWEVAGERRAVLVNLEADFARHDGNTSYPGLGGRWRAALERSSARHLAATAPDHRPCRPPRRVRATLLHAETGRWCSMDLHLEMCIACLAGAVKVFEPDAALSAKAGRFDTRDRPSRPSGYA